MDYLHLTLTSKCNQDCLFCLIKGEPIRDLSFREAVLKLKGARKKGAINLGIDGGEPTLIPFFSKLLDESIKLGYKNIHLKTNGFGFVDFRKATKILKGKENILKIYLSLHGPNKKIHDTLTQTRGSFNKTIKAIKNIIKLQGKIVANIVICSENYKFLNEYIDLLDKLHIRESIFLFIAAKGNALNNSFLIPKIDEVIPFVQKAIAYADSKQIYVSLTFFPFCSLTEYNRTHTVEFTIAKSVEEYDEQNKEKYKGKICQQCIYFNNCPGVWSEYYKLYKFNFKPIK